ncbi:carbohydrate ABC transporter permease [Crossiella cryophila]|uniref:Multiple sugar transport system permease protein n=1 Tax=Crossiella cryophila TaxID=43355 RepID=A0A7W7CH72_9PSEU|nr:carbohydrate ABC transporter permease [Crossiella cryophila]MBB4681192.1 multiple sugar transport system permease protein [Crossiella cryophila]
MSAFDRERPAARATRLSVALALALMWLLPLGWALSTALRPEADTTRIPVRWLPERPTLDAFGKVLGETGLLTWFGNSVLVGVLVTVLTVLLASMAAYGLSRTEFRGRQVLLWVIVAGIVVPPQVLIVPLFSQMVGLGLVDTYWGLVLPQIVLPAMVYVLKKFFDGVPRELEEAARVDGASRWRIYWSIMLPLARPALAAVAIFTFVTTWNNFLWPFIVATDPDMMTIPVGLASVQSSYGLRYAQVMAGSVLGGLPLLVFFLVFQRQVVRGITTTGVKG